MGNNQLVYPLQFIYGVVSAKEGEIDITSFGRFMRYSLCVHLEESNLESVFTTMLANSCINMQPEICLEITAASAQIFNEISKLHPILDPEHHHDDDPEGDLYFKNPIFILLFDIYSSFLISLSLSLLLSIKQ